MNSSTEISLHPCFAERANQYARIHLPVAPVCNIQCRYCLRKYCCANECRPGVTARVLTPQEALAWYTCQKTITPDITVAGIAGPGDALANWSVTKETLRLIRKLDPSVFFCLSTNGLLLPEYVQDMTDAGVKFLTVTVNCTDPETGVQIYSFVNYNGTIYRGKEAAELLFRQQITGIKMAKREGIFVKINSVVIEGVNDTQIKSVAKLAGQLKCDVMNIIPLLPVPGSELGNKRPPSCERNGWMNCADFAEKIFVR